MIFYHLQALVQRVENICDSTYGKNRFYHMLRVPLKIILFRVQFSKFRMKRGGLERRFTLISTYPFSNGLSSRFQRFKT